MSERPILFSGPMIRALLDGRKTQTRRVVKWPGQVEPDAVEAHEEPPGEFAPWLNGERLHTIKCPHGVPGDRLWVRETWGLNDYQFERGPIPKARPPQLEDNGLCYAATEDDSEIRNELRWRPSIHMPRWASRLTLEITDVRVERLQDISATDAEAEGVREPSIGPFRVFSQGASGVLDPKKADPLLLWQILWKSINGDDSWAANPWVWVITFPVPDAKGAVDE
jgi:hypothetical protein